MDPFKNKIHAPYEFEYILSRLFGNRTYNGFCNIGNRPAVWKRHISRVLKSLRKAVITNVKLSDRYQQRILTGICDNGLKTLKDAKTIHQINFALIICLVRLVFSLLGRMPNYYNRRLVTSRHDWDLSGHRTLIYVQNERQKANLIRSLSEEGPYVSRFSKSDELFHKYVGDYRGKPEAFVNWFKQNYPDIYVELF